MNTEVQKPHLLKELASAKRKVTIGAGLNIFAISLWVLVASVASNKSQNESELFWSGLVLIFCLLGSPLALITSFFLSLTGALKITKILNYKGISRFITCFAQVIPLVQLYTIFLFRNQEERSDSLFDMDIHEYIQSLKDRPIEEYDEPVDIATLERQYMQWIRKPHKTIEYQSSLSFWKILVIAVLSLIYGALYLTGWLSLGSMLLAFTSGFGGWQFSRATIEVNIRSQFIVLSALYGIIGFLAATGRCGLNITTPSWWLIFITFYGITAFPSIVASILQRAGAKIVTKTNDPTES